MLADEFGRYRAHIVRKHKASAGQLDMLSQVTSDRIMIFCDYKQKVLPRKWREAQSETFGKKGKSLCGVAVVFKLPPGFEGEVPKGIDREGDFAISYTRAEAHLHDHTTRQQKQNAGQRTAFRSAEQMFAGCQKFENIFAQKAKFSNFGKQKINFWEKSQTLNFWAAKRFA